jgi:hypothetical protein
MQPLVVTRCLLLLLLLLHHLCHLLLQGGQQGCLAQTLFFEVTHAVCIRFVIKRKA